MAELIKENTNRDNKFQAFFNVKLETVIIKNNTPYLSYKPATQ